MLDPTTILVALGALASASAAGLVWALWNAVAPHQPLVKRAQVLREEREGRRRRRSGAKEADQPITLSRLLKLTARRFDGLRNHAGAEVAERLMRAGWRGKDAVILFLVAKIALPFVGGVVVLLCVNVLQLVELDPALERFAPAAGVLIGFVMPGLIVDKAIARREKAVARTLPDALDLLVICAEAGLALDAALQRVANEMEMASPPVADELGLTAAERRILPDRRKALDNLVQRCQISSVKSLVQTLVQAEQYGTALSQSLRVVATELRSERMLKAEEKASKLPVKMTVPLVAFIMPALFIVLIGPGIITTMDALGAN